MSILAVSTTAKGGFYGVSSPGGHSLREEGWPEGRAQEVKGCWEGVQF